jgi:hypothetical protein
VAIAE